MRLHRFIGDFNLSKDAVEIRNIENIKQIKGVLRLGVGDHLILCDGSGRSGEYKIDKVEKSLIECSLVKELQPNEPQRSVHLYLAILKKENFELAIQKAVECGVSHITPVITDRTIKNKIKVERAQKIILEATEQSGRTSLATLNPIQKFADAIESDTSKQKIIFHTKASESFMEKEKADSLSVYIGPEGGFSEAEVARASELGASTCSLGHFTLRGETAAIVASFLAAN